MTRNGNASAARAARMLATASYIGAGVIPGQGGGPKWPSLYLGPVANRIMYANEGLGTTAKQIMAQTHHVAMDTSANYLRVRYPNYFPQTGGGGGEVNCGGAATGRCSIYFYNPTTSMMTMVRMLQFSDGNQTATAPDGGVFDFLAPVSIPQGSHFWLRFWGDRSAGQWAYAHGQADYANGDILRYGATTPDLTGTTTAFTDTYNGALDRFGPCNILGYTLRPTLADWGDSIGAGLKAAPSGLFGNNGTGQKLFAERMASVNLSVPGELSASLADRSKTAKRRIEAASCSHALIEIGSNSAIASNIDAATVMADVQQLRADLGMPAIIATIPPWTDQGGGGNTLSNKRAADANAVNFNALARAVPAGFAGVFDRAAALEDASRLWGSVAYQSDWVHPSTAGEERVRSFLAGFDFSKVGNPAPVYAGFELPTATVYRSKDLAGWTLTAGAARLAQDAYSPEHKLNAAVIRELAADNNHSIVLTSSITGLASTTKEYSVSIARGVGNRHAVVEIGKNGGNYYAMKYAVNLSTGAITAAPNEGTVQVTQIAVATLDPDGFWRVVIRITYDATMPNNPYLFVRMVDSPTEVNPNYVGDNTSTLKIWGFDVK